MRDLSDLDIKPTMHQQYLTMKKMVTQKLLLLQNTKTADKESIYEELRQDNLWLNSKIHDLTRELRSTIAVRITSARTMATPSESITLDPRVAAAVVGPQIP